MKRTAMFLTATLALALPALAAVESGLKIGETVTPFHPKHVSGPNKDTEACPPCTYGNRPAVQAWMNQDDPENVSAISGALNDAVKGSKHELKGFVIMLTMCDKCVENAKTVGASTKSTDIGIAHLPVNDQAVKNYKVNTAGEVKNTIIFYKDKKVVAKLVNLKADKKGLEELKAAIAKIDN